MSPAAAIPVGMLTVSVGIISSDSSSLMTDKQNAMIKNYFKTAWRSLWKNKTFSAINIFGLSIGVAAFLLIINYLRFEHSYDDAHVKKDRIYHVPMMTKEKGGKEQTFAFTYPAVAPALKKDFPEIEEAARFRRQGGIVTYKDQRIVENGSLY